MGSGAGKVHARGGEEHQENRRDRAGVFRDPTLRVEAGDPCVAHIRQGQDSAHAQNHQDGHCHAEGKQRGAKHRSNQGEENPQVAHHQPHEQRVRAGRAEANNHPQHCQESEDEQREVAEERHGDAGALQRQIMLRQAWPVCPGEHPP